MSIYRLLNSAYSDTSTIGYIGERLVQKGVIEEGAILKFDKYLQKREIEEHEEVIKERLMKAGFIADESQWIWRGESPKRPDELGYICLHRFHAKR